MELSLPITVYWDLAMNAPDSELLPRFCSEILECHPLMLQLYDPSPKLSAAVVMILKRFKGEQVAVSLTLPVSSLLFDKDLLAEVRLKELLITSDNLKSITEFPFSAEVGLSFSVNSNNWRELPSVITFCRNHGINRLVLPMQRLFYGEEPFYLAKIEQFELEKALVKVGGVAGLRLTIHDPFLWRAFNPGIPFPQGGCQAANTMVAISPDDSVYPCPTMPYKIGTIGDVLSLKEIINSAAKKELRSRILGVPDACNSCQELSVCKGGCRGRSLLIHGSFDGVDDACR